LAVDFKIPREAENDRLFCCFFKVFKTYLNKFRARAARVSILCETRKLRTKSLQNAHEKSPKCAKCARKVFKVRTKSLQKIGINWT
jgi:hypothetical protein